MNPPLPEQGDRPYQYRFSPRNIGSDIVRGLLPAPVNFADRLFGNNIRNGVDRMFGGTRDRYLADESAYMRDMMRSDPGNQSNSFFRNLFGGDRTGAPPMPQVQRDSAQTFPYRDSWEGSGPITPAERERVEASNRMRDALRREQLTRFGERNRSGGRDAGRPSTGYMGDLAHNLTRQTTVEDIDMMRQRDFER